MAMDTTAMDTDTGTMAMDMVTTTARGRLMRKLTTAWILWPWTWTRLLWSWTWTRVLWPWTSWILLRIGSLPTIVCIITVHVTVNAESCSPHGDVSNECKLTQCSSPSTLACEHDKCTCRVPSFECHTTTDCEVTMGTCHHEADSTLGHGHHPQWHCIDTACECIELPHREH